MNNFFYVIMLLITFFGVATGIYAARSMKKAEQFIPANAEFEAAQAAKKAGK